MKLVASGFLLFSSLAAQYLPGQYPPGQYPPGQYPLPQTQRHRTGSSSKPADSLNGLLVTFRGTFKEVSKKEITIETEDQPIFNIGRSHKTKFMKDGKEIKPESILVGAALTIDVTKDPDLNPLAVVVTVDPAQESGKPVALQAK